MHKAWTGLVSGAAALAVAAVVGGGATSNATARSTATTQPLQATGFNHPVSNPWFPLAPGTATVLRGTDGGQHFRERVRVTDRRRSIQGIRTRAVRDVLRRTDGTLAEFTTDWYADDNQGNVWYFGERTATYDRHGHLQSREGSWQAGAHGARAGLIMPATPHAAEAYRQEYLPGHAEDQAWIVGFKRAVHVPLGRFRHIVRSFEWSKLEPRVLSTKLYARGIGIVEEADLVGGSERFEVVKVHRAVSGRQ